MIASSSALGKVTPAMDPGAAIDAVSTFWITEASIFEENRRCFVTPSHRTTPSANTSARGSSATCAAIGEAMDLTRSGAA